MGFRVDGSVRGNLVQDPELKVGRDGKPFVRFSIASNERKFDEKEQRWVDGETTFHNSFAFGHLAERIAAMKKGTPVVAVGQHDFHTYDDHGTQREGRTFYVSDLGRSELVTKPESRTRSEGVSQSVSGAATVGPEAGPAGDEPWGEQEQANARAAQAGYTIAAPGPGAPVVVAQVEHHDAWQQPAQASSAPARPVGFTPGR